MLKINIDVMGGPKELAEKVKEVLKAVNEDVKRAVSKATEQFKQQPVGLEAKDITCEAWRKYVFTTTGVEPDENGDFPLTSVDIENPQRLYIGKTTHRVVDAEGIVHCVPAPGHFGCVLSWKNKEGHPEVVF